MQILFNARRVTSEPNFSSVRPELRLACEVSDDQGRELLEELAQKFGEQKVRGWLEDYGS